MWWWPASQPASQPAAVVQQWCSSGAPLLPHCPASQPARVCGIPQKPMKFDEISWTFVGSHKPHQPSQPSPAQPSPAQPSPAQPSPAQPSQPLGATRNLLGATRGSVLQCFARFLQCFAVFCKVFAVFCSVSTVFCSVLQGFFAVFAGAAKQTAAEQPPRNPVLGSVFPAPAAACMLSAVNRTQEMLHLSPPNPPKKTQA